MASLASLDLELLKARFSLSSERAEAAPLLVTGWPELDEALPDGGLPRGVVELSAPHAVGGPSSVALAAVRAAHAKDARAWCAWIDPEGTLFAPAALRAGVDLARLLVVRPPRRDFARIAVKVAASGAFDVVVVDVDAVPGARQDAGTCGAARRGQGEVFVRKLALVAEETGATILLVTDATRPRAAPLPVALRLELLRLHPEELQIYVAKERRGRIGLKKTIPMATRPSTRSA